MATYSLSINAAVNLTSTTTRTTTGSTTTTVYTVPANTYLDCTIECDNTAQGAGGGASLGRADLVLGGVTIPAARSQSGGASATVTTTQTYKLGPGTTIQTVLFTNNNAPNAQADNTITIIGTLFNG